MSCLSQREQRRLHLTRVIICRGVSPGNSIMRLKALLSSEFSHSVQSAKKYVPTYLRDKQVMQTHTSPPTGLLGAHRTHQHLQCKYRWPHMLSDIHKFTSLCTTCAQNKVSRTCQLEKYSHCRHHSSHGRT